MISKAKNNPDEILKKELINMENETDRLTFIKNIFDNILKQPKKLKNENFPEA